MRAAHGGRLRSCGGGAVALFGGRVCRGRLSPVAARARAETEERAGPSPSIPGSPFTSVALEAVTTTVIEASRGTREGVQAPDAKKTLVAVDDSRRGVIDRDDGLPATYDRAAIQTYWDERPGELQKRWGDFVRLNVPYLTRIATILLSGGTLEAQSGPLSRNARIIMETLGPTYVKMGQMLSVRPDVLPEAARAELAILQDSVKPFDNAAARTAVETSLGRPIEEVFSSFSEAPVAAASLAQVHRATLRSNGQEVAVKVQRPNVIETVSKDLYVLRRAAEVYQAIMDRFAPQQRTDYVALLNEWAIGFYTELDFKNEATNQVRFRAMMEEAGVKDVYVPEVYMDLCSRYVVVTEWVDGVKLLECSPDEINELVAIGQECFLTQLLQTGFFHCDPHPGNLMKLNDQSKGKLALLDFGLMATLTQDEMDTLVSSIIHLSNKDYDQLCDDFVALNVLPDTVDRQKVLPLMDKALSPFIKGGGAQRYRQEIERQYEGAGGGLSAMTSDFVTVMNDIPFSIPPYFALLGRAVATLEGIALVGNPDYRLIMESYPFVSRKLLSEDRPAFQKALTDILYTKGGDKTLQSQRLAVLLNSARGIVAETDSFVDLDTLPENSMGAEEAVAFFFADEASSLRKTLMPEVANAADLLLRQGLRRLSTQLEVSLPRLPFMPPAATALPVPFVSVGPAGDVRPTLSTVDEIVNALAPKLTADEELFALSLLDLASVVTGLDVKTLVYEGPSLDPTAILDVARGVVTGSVDLDEHLPGLQSLRGFGGLMEQEALRKNAETFVVACAQQLQERYTARIATKEA